MCLNFVVPGFRQKIFYTEFFPNYGILLIICHNQSTLMQSSWHLHIISSQNASHAFTRFLWVYAKAELRTILHHQVCHPIANDVMKGIKKALSVQLHNLAFFTFICSSEFTNSLNNWLHP